MRSARAPSAPSRLDTQTWIAHHLGWPDLKADTHPGESKFNVWVFYDPTKSPRRALGRFARGFRAAVTGFMALTGKAESASGV